MSIQSVQSGLTDGRAMKNIIIALAVFAGWVAVLLLAVLLDNKELPKRVGALVVMLSIFAAWFAEMMHRTHKTASEGKDVAKSGSSVAVGADAKRVRALRKVAERSKIVGDRASSLHDIWLSRHLFMAGVGELFHGFGDLIYLIFRPAAVGLVVLLRSILGS